jgi:hypothetical protein
VERGWFRRAIAEEDVPTIYTTAEHPDADLFPLDDADWSADLATWQAECAAARAVAGQRDLDATGRGRGPEVSLRWVYVHMIEEYARHNGHADRGVVTAAGLTAVPGRTVPRAASAA